MLDGQKPLRGDIFDTLELPSPPSDLQSGGRLLDTDFGPVAFAIKPYFPRSEIIELVGAHGLFKSTLALYACLSVATGRTWAGFAVTRGKACFLTLEDSERTIANRVRCWLASVPESERAATEAGIRENFRYQTRDGLRGLAITKTLKNGTSKQIDAITILSQQVTDAAIVVLETASRLHEGPEVNEALAVFAQAIEQIAIDAGAAVVIVRHVSKAAAQEARTDSYAGRGGGALSDAARSILVVTLDQKTPDYDPYAQIRVTHAKSTLTKRGPSIVWEPTRFEAEGVYLRALDREERTTESAGDDDQVFGAIDKAGAEGIIRSDLVKGSSPLGMTRKRANAAIDRLLDAGRITAKDEKRGKTTATVYRAKRENAT